MTKEKKKPALELKVALETVRHLGMNLYSSLPPVISELVANAYDARARHVWITIAEDNKSITIKDDGIGMSRLELQDKYLAVGRDRRAEDKKGRDLFPTFPKRSAPMGRKGIGKLAMFSIADVAHVYTRQNGISCAIKLSRQDIESAIKKGKPYHPKELKTGSGLNQGTKIVLKNLKKARISASLLRKAVARRFSVIDLIGEPAKHDFTVHVNDEPVSVEDWDVYKSLQYIWHFGPRSKKYADRCNKDAKAFNITNDIVGLKASKISGWVGTVDKPSLLHKERPDGTVDFNDNKMIIDSRGKVSVSDILHHFGESRIFASYLTGYIRADFLDSDDKDDIATSDRERMKETDTRVKKLTKLVNGILDHVAKEWTPLRRANSVEKASKNPVVKQWFDSLSSGNKTYAAKLFGRLETINFDRYGDKIQVMKSLILAFERLKVNNELHLIDSSEEVTSAESIRLFSNLFAMERDLEGALYSTIAKSRLDIIDALKNLIDQDVAEKVIQKYIYDNLWLIEPSWTGDSQVLPRIEESVIRAFDKETKSLKKEERRWRLDIRYRRASGVHVIVELKKYSARTNDLDLMNQVLRYREVLKRVLIEHCDEYTDKSPPQVVCVCLVGREPASYMDDPARTLSTQRVRVLRYNSVIAESQARFKAYLDAQNKFALVQSVLKKLDRQIQDGVEY